MPVQLGFGRGYTPVVGPMNLYRLPENIAYFLCHVLHFVKCHGHVLCDFYFFIFISKPLKCLQIWIYKCNIYNIRVQIV